MIILDIDNLDDNQDLTPKADVPLEYKLMKFNDQLKKQVSFEVTGGEQWTLESELSHSNLKEILNLDNSSS